MAITLDGTALPDDLIWSDEYDWSTVSQNISKSITGNLIIQEASQQKGRKFTLSGSEDSAWITKATLDLLQAKVDTTDLQMTLNYHGTNYNVMFNRSGNESPLSTRQIYNLAAPDSDHIYSITINLFEV